MRGDIRPENVSGGQRCEDRPRGARWVGPELRAVLAGARRRAHRDAERQIDTAHLLHAVLESDAPAREALGRAARSTNGDPALRAARVLAYLAQRSIGYGLRWRSVIEGAGPRPAVSGSGSGSGSCTTGFSPLAVAALADAAARAAARGADRITGPDLLGALAADPESRSVEVLRAAGVLPERLAARPCAVIPDTSGTPESVDLAAIVRAAEAAEAADTADAADNVGMPAEV